MTYLMIASIVLNIILILLFFIERLQRVKLHKENLKLKRRKVQASEQMIQSFEKAMVAAIDTGNLKRYQEYRDMYNDLVLKNPSISASIEKRDVF